VYGLPCGSVWVHGGSTVGCMQWPLHRRVRVPGGIHQLHGIHLPCGHVLVGKCRVVHGLPCRSVWVHGGSTVGCMQWTMHRRVRMPSCVCQCDGSDLFLGHLQLERRGRLHQLQRGFVRVGCSHERVDVQRSVRRGSFRVDEWSDVVVVCRELQRRVRVRCGVCQLYGFDLSGGSVLPRRVARPLALSTRCANVLWVAAHWGSCPCVAELSICPPVQYPRASRAWAYAHARLLKHTRACTVMYCHVHAHASTPPCAIFPPLPYSPPSHIPPTPYSFYVLAW
jgi:hypothetical protein